MSDIPGKKFYNIDQPSGKVPVPSGSGLKFTGTFSSILASESEVLAFPTVFTHTPGGESEAWTHT